MIASRRELLLALGVFFMLALALSWPLPARLAKEIPGGDTPRDAMHLLYALTWSSQALGDRPFELFQATILYPHHTPLVFLDHMVGLAALVAPINWATGSMSGGYNFAWLLTFALSGLGAYLLTRYLGGSGAGALLAGILYAYFPARTGSEGQINVLAMMWIPFALLSLHLWVETRLRRELFLFLGFALLQFFSSAYTGLFLMIAVLLYGVVLLIVEPRPTVDLVRSRHWTIIAVVFLGLIVVFPMMLPYLWATREEAGYLRPLAETAAYSAVPADFITPGAGTALHEAAPWKAAARYPAFPGVIAVTLLVAWFAMRGWRRDPVHRGEMLFYAALIPVALVLSLGPRLGGGDSGLPLPFGLVYHGLPGGAFLREPARFLLLASLGTAVLAGLGLSFWLDRRPRRSPWRLAVGAVPVLALLELFAGPPKLINPVPGGIPAVYTWLGSVEGPLVVLELPMPADHDSETVDHARYQLYSLVHKKRLVNGVAASVPRITREIRREMQEFPNNGSVRRLQEIGVSYVLVHPDLYPPEEVSVLAARVRTADGIHVVDMSGPIWILDVVPREPGRLSRPSF